MVSESSISLGVGVSERSTSPKQLPKARAAAGRPNLDEAGVRQVREYAKLEREVAASRPSEALPRRLQACMQELLAVNERYHELLAATSGQGE